MTDAVAPLPLGIASLGGVEFDNLAFLGRVGDGLVYTARLDGQDVRIREYAPHDVVRRRADAGLEPLNDEFADAWAEGQARFLALATQLARLRHPALPHVVHAFASEESDSGAWLVTRSASAPLAETLGGDETLPPDQIMRIAGELADALTVLHAQGLAHLDIAPETVSIASGRVELHDIAIDNRRFIALTGSQDGFVRPGYSPIERADATAAEPLEPTTDIYAASALLYRLIEGRDPAPWEERWRDTNLASLPDRDPYPPSFLAAIRRGLAIEPAERFPDAATWRAAMALPGAEPPPVNQSRPSLPAYPPPHASPPRAAPAPVPTANWLVPLLVALIVVAVAGLGYIAYQQGWFGREDAPVANVAIPAPAPTPVPAPQPVEPAAPQLVIGSRVAGQLSASDSRTGAGQYADSYVIDARGGERLDISLSSAEFDPVLRITGPGLSESNDDDAESGGRDSRLVVTLPRAGRYTVTATSYSRGETGAYLLEVAAAGAEPVKPDDVTTVDLSSATRLSGRWSAEDDERCEEPAINIVAGDRLISRIGSQTHTHRIVESDGETIRTEATAGPAAGRSFTFRLAPDGESYEIEGETWLRCRT